MTKLRVRNSAISDYQRCRRRWGLIWQEGIRSADTSISRPLTFGTAFHAALETWYSLDGTVPERIIAAQQAFAANATQLSWEDRVLGPALMIGYAAMYSSDELRMYSLPAAEAEVTLPMLDPDGAVDPDLEYGGTLDMIGYDPQQRTIIIDHKTTASNINTLSFWERFDRSLQLPLYWLAALDSGRTPHELIVNVVRAPVLHRGKATPLESREFYKRATGTAAVGDPKPGTRLHDETREEFEARVVEDILNNPQDYYARKSYAYSEHDLQLARADLWADSRSMLDSIRSGVATSRNPGGCFKYNQVCEFEAACWRGADLGDRQLYQLRRQR